MTVVRSIALFAVAGLAEIGGGYLMWLWLREGRPLWVGLAHTANLEIEKHEKPAAISVTEHGGYPEAYSLLADGTEVSR